MDEFCHSIMAQKEAMTTGQAALLQATWDELGSPLCEHRKVELERSEDGYVTGNYRCIACGDALAS